MARYVAVGLVVMLCLGSVPASAFQVSTAVPLDHSWTSETYVDAGLPSPDRVWTPEDYGKAIPVLKGTTENTRLHLPRFKGFHSGAVFARFISEENLAVLRDESVAWESRLKSGTGIDHGLRKLLAIYRVPAFGGGRFDEELVELMAFRLKVLRDLLKLGGNGKAVAVDDTSDADRRQAIANLLPAFGLGVTEVVRELENRHPYRGSARLVLARHLGAMLPELVPQLGEKRQASIRSRVGILARNYKDTELGDVLTALHEKLPEG